MRLPKLAPQKKYLIFSTALLTTAAIFLTWFLQYRYFLNDAASTWEFFITRAPVFWFSALLILLALVFLTGLTRRPIIAIGSLWIFLLIFTHIHISKFHVRGFPLLPEDFELSSEAASLSKFIDIGALIRLILAALLIIALTIITNHLITKHYSLKTSRSQTAILRRLALPGRLAMVTISLLCLISLTYFARHHEGARSQPIPWLATEFVAWNQVINYDQVGFILGFLYNLQKLELVPPTNYTDQKIAEIHATYEKLAKSSNKAKIDIAEEDVNLIIVLNESFFDPAAKFQGFSFEDFYPHTGGEILPTLRSLQAHYPSGQMYSLDYGGGTATIEFEALTGLTNYWINTVPYTHLLPKTDTSPSIASYLKSKNYKTTAIHPFNGSMYKRNLALHTLGYDTFITELEMQYTEKETDRAIYINDRSAYHQALDILESTDQNQLITLITMQNHMPYNADIYENTQFATTALSPEDEHYTDISTYYQSLHNSDAYLSEFIAALDRSDKKVALLFFGDHSAGIFSLTNGSSTKEIRDLSRITPYFIYTNYNASQTAQTLPTTTPNCLPNTLMNTLGIQKPTLYYLLDEICQQTPILAPAWFEATPPTDTTALSAYQLVTYDILGGKKYWRNY